MVHTPTIFWEKSDPIFRPSNSFGTHIWIGCWVIVQMMNAKQIWINGRPGGLPNGIMLTIDIYNPKNRYSLCVYNRMERNSNQFSLLYPTKVLFDFSWDGDMFPIRVEILTNYRSKCQMMLVAFQY